jgi:dCTP deaminase
MILSDREIKAALARQAIRITPDPRQDPDVWSSTALDLRLDGSLACWTFPKGKRVPFRPADPGYDHNAMVEKYTKTLAIPAQGHLMKPGEFLLGWTVEKIQLPSRSRIAARVEGRSSLARLGIGVHVTATTVHAGFGYKETAPTYLGSSI